MTRGISVKVFSPKKNRREKSPKSDTSLLKKLLNVDLAVAESARIDEKDGSLVVEVRPRKSQLCRWPGWLSLCDESVPARSMPRKACSPDNSAMEGFFERLKNTDNGNRAIVEGYRRKFA